MDAASAFRPAAHRSPGALVLLEGLADYVHTGHGDVDRLTDIEPTELRLRLGDYRIRFFDHAERIQILRVLHRKEASR